MHAAEAVSSPLSIVSSHSLALSTHALVEVPERRARSNLSRRALQSLPSRSKAVLSRASNRFLSFCRPHLVRDPCSPTMWRALVAFAWLPQAGACDARNWTGTDGNKQCDFTADDSLRCASVVLTEGETNCETFCSNQQHAPLRCALQ